MGWGYLGLRGSWVLLPALTATVSDSHWSSADPGGGEATVRPPRRHQKGKGGLSRQAGAGDNMAITTLLLLAFATCGLVAGQSDRLLPPVFAIPRNTTASLDVDLFFSLFFVFLNKDLKETSSDYTIFAPAGLTTQEAARWLGEEALTEQLLLDHIVVGTHLRPELVASSGSGGPWTTLGGEEVSVAIDDQGEFRVNGVRVLAWTTEGPALIVVLEDYLFKEKGLQKDEDLKSSQELEKVDKEQTTKRSIKEVTDKGEFPQAKPRKANQRNCTKVS